jgi:hypothetical protein
VTGGSLSFYPHGSEGGIQVLILHPLPYVSHCPCRTGKWQQTIGYLRDISRGWGFRMKDR